DRAELRRPVDDDLGHPLVLIALARVVGIDLHQKAVRSLAGPFGRAIDGREHQQRRRRQKCQEKQEVSASALEWSQHETFRTLLGGQAETQASSLSRPPVCPGQTEHTTSFWRAWLRAGSIKSRSSSSAFVASPGPIGTIPEISFFPISHCTR